MSSSPDLKYWLALSRFPLFGAVRIAKLARAFPNMERAFSASVTDLLEAGIPPDVANRFLQERMHLDPDRELARMQEACVSVLTIHDQSYPPLLKQIYDPPALLFYRGTFPHSEKKHLAIVGSRHVTSYGTRAVEQIVGPLAASGVVIVSGLAYGVDALAHRTTIEQGGITIAVLGSGIDDESIYPSANRALSSMILARGGLILSEFPIGTPPLKHHFPFRNRIIAGLCHGTMVIEATQKSGSLITARCALEIGRDVYAVPGSIESPLSEGPNNLIKMGATPVTCASDIMEGCKHDTFSYESRSEIERELLAKLSRNPIHLDELTRTTNIPMDAIGSAITLLEMKGIVRHEGGRYYTRMK